jgi:glycosyltransferase involved in cell wall biosynthesis
VLARNEAASGRYLQRVIAHCQTFSDAVLLLDDRSADDTAKVASDLGCLVKTRGAFYEPAWGKETPARAQLWEWAAHEAGRDNGWVLVCDADMLLQGEPAAIRALCWSWEVVAWAMPLADAWGDEQHYRVDGPWAGGPTTARPWLFKASAAPQGWQPTWSGRGIHSGHCPANFGELGPCLVAPPDVFWLHMAYVSPEHRKEKAARYAAVAAQMSDFERAHAASILDI